MLILLIGTELYLAVILKGLQFRALPHALKMIFHKELGQGDISHFAAPMTAPAATVGIGNIVGAMLNLELVWDIWDVMNGMMAIPNLIGLLLLSGVIRREIERYFAHTGRSALVPSTRERS